MKSIFRNLTWLAAALAGFAGAASLARAQAVLPDGRVNAAYSFTIVTNPAAPAGTVYQATNLPAGLAINASSGNISGTPSAPGTAAGTISLTTSGATNNFNYQLTIDPVLGTPVITSPTSASGAVGAAFTYPASASGTPTSFNITGLPAGLSANSTTGAITGTPGAAGTFSISLSANNATGGGSAVTLTLTVAPAAGTPVITSPSSATGTPGTAFTYGITASNVPTLYSAIGLPLGISLNSATGAITGTPTIAGVSTVMLSASNGAGTGPAASLTITIGALPIVTTAANVSATSGQSFSLQLAATPAATSFNVAGLPAGLAATAAGLISGTPSTTGSYAITASGNNGLGTGPTATVTLAVAAPGGGGFGGGGTLAAPVIVTQPLAQTVTAGGSATFVVLATTTSGTLSYQWLFNGAAISGATSSSLAISGASSAAAGLYSVVVSNGTAVTSNSARLTVTSVVVPLTISSQPASQTVNAGSTVAFSVAASGAGSLSYQWQKNGAAIAGATGASLTLANVQAADAGNYTVVLNDGTNRLTSATAVLTVIAPAPPSRLVNVSLRGVSGPGAQSLTVGLSIGGNGTKSALVRAIGPTLATFGVAGILADPQLTLYTSSGTQIAIDDDWGGSAALSAAFAQTGAFPLAAASKDAALLTSLAAGQFTARVSTASGDTGVVLLEAYDADTAATPSARFANLSCLGTAGSGANLMTIGFSISGSAVKTLLIRGIGPTLSQFGVASPLAATTLTLFDSHQAVVGTNSGWGGTTALANTFAQVGAFPLPAASQDSALLVNLQPGVYTAQLTGAAGTSGIALIELYDVQ